MNTFAPNDKISVIVPVYNTENHLDRCIQSILAQQHTNLEILLIDDGSTDGSGRICDAWAAKDRRTVVIHKAHGGVSDARNTGINAATGRYVAFVDSDDYIAPEMLEKLYCAVVDAHADMSMCSFLYVDENGRPLPERNLDNPIKTQILSGPEVIKKRFEQNGWYFIVVWNKLYDRKLFSDLCFPAGKTHEDEFFAHRVMKKCNKIACISEPYYYYVQRPGSIMASRNMKTELNRIEAFLDRALCCHEIGLDQYSGQAYWKAAITFLNNYVFAGTPCFPENELRDALQMIRAHSWLKKYCPMKKHLQIDIICKSPAVYCAIFRNPVRKALKSWSARIIRGAAGQKV